MSEFPRVSSGRDVNWSLCFSGAGLGRVVQAEEYLSQAQWTILKSTECSYATQSLLHRNLGLVCMAKGNCEEARDHLANDVRKPALSLLLSLSENSLSEKSCFLFPEHLSKTCCLRLTV